MQDLRPLAALCSECGAAYAENVPLEKYTTFRIGGNCDAMAELPDAEAAQKIVRYLKETGIPFRLIGKGSNLLVRDEGYHGVMLRLTGSLEEVSPAENGRLRCGAGAPLKSLCLAALKASLTGLEFAYGIPGTVGGAVYMNAGAYDGDISQVLTEVTYLDEAGTLPLRCSRENPSRSAAGCAICCIGGRRSSRWNIPVRAAPSSGRRGAMPPC